MPTTAFSVVSLYLAAVATFAGAVGLRTELPSRQHNPLVRGLERGEIRAGVPRLDPDDSLANASLLRMALADVGTPGLDDDRCTARPRVVTTLLGGRRTTVRFGGRAVCQLKRLKEISVAQPGFGARGLGEVAAFLLGRRMGGDVDVTRVVVPPFRFRGDRVWFDDMDLGALLRDESFIGTYHTHPDGDLEQGLLSLRDLRFMRLGHADFHGEIGRLSTAKARVDWLLDIVETRDGDWNVFMHDADKLEALRQACEAGPFCPLDELRLTNSKYAVSTRFFEDGALE